MIYKKENQIDSQRKRVLITGVSGLLGSNIVEQFVKKRNYELYGTYLHNKVKFKGCEVYKVDLANTNQVNNLLQETYPDIIIHCAALTNVDLCEKDKKQCYQNNVVATKNLVEGSEKNRSKIIYISTDAVYGDKEEDSKETDDINPVNYYVESKVEAEKIVRKKENSCILRTNIYGSINPNIYCSETQRVKYSLAEWFIKKLHNQEQITGFTDIIFNPISVINLAAVINEVIKRDISSVFNVGGPEKIDKYNFGIKIAKIFDFDKSLIKQGISNQINFFAPRPKNTTMDISKAQKTFDTKLLSVGEGLEEMKLNMVSPEIKDGCAHEVKVGERIVGEGHPCYIVAEIGSNFDGSIERAKKLIDLAKESGAEAVKFQSFKSEKIICGKAFEDKGGFQALWDKSVEQVYKENEFPREWHKILFDYAASKGLHFFSAPYDFEAVELLDQIGVPAFKIGSGDITWLEMLEKIAKKNKPIILATGASTLAEIDEAVQTIKNAGNNQIILLQCVTNYPSKFESANLRVLESLKKTYGCPIGYSDHTPGHTVPLGTVALGGCVIEKHFTDDKRRPGPDHHYSMDVKDFKEMCEQIRKLEKSMGSPLKRIYKEENETVVLQRRCLRAKQDLSKGEIITRENINVLRPAPDDAMYPKYIKKVVGKILKEDINKGDYLKWTNF
ncbi:MAG: N-acetylneuraminate synthase family protein [Nanoarchaeota archaeon]|nr:N-acetylneuraminate synthase family protein [Nanoarchaeota archaeon]